jgi:beta-glucanase (GH16 family)
MAESNLVVHHFDHTGELRFDALDLASEYRIEWSSSMAGRWTNFAAASQSLDSIPATGSGVVTVSVPMLYRVVAIVPEILDAAGTLEAENYSDMSGIQIEPDGEAIGYFDGGDWIQFENVDFGDGMRSVTFSASKANSYTGIVELRVGGLAGTSIGTFIPDPTGAWSIYTEQQTNISLISGIHDLYVVGVGTTGVCNLDWLSFSSNAVYVPNYALAWEDEFTGTVLNTTYWHPVQHGDVDNGELQFYTDREKNISVSNGYLWLRAHDETYVGTGPWMSGTKTSEYTSGKVQGEGKITFQYGKIESRMKLPRGEGTWPAFWMLGDNIFDAGVGWPRCGEIDIMEHAHVLDNIGAAIHTEAYNHADGTQKTGTYIISDYDTAFHTYGVEWTTNKLAFYVDDDIFFTVTKEALGSTEEEWPFDQPFWLILNLAVGGAWGGDPTGGDYPYTLEVDWVRVYEDQGP